MSAIGEGETQLLVPDTTAQGQFIPAAGQKNRRVEIQILG
jgi:outer membrane protein OmpA-like peptidoglycan-associated protein